MSSEIGSYSGGKPREMPACIVLDVRRTSLIHSCHMGDMLQLALEFFSINSQLLGIALSSHEVLSFKLLLLKLHFLKTELQ